jgi:hypothetical protein
VLHNFAGGAKDGAGPWSGPILTSQGTLVGATLYGGAANLGAIYRLTPPIAGGAWTEHLLHGFTASDQINNPLYLTAGAHGAFFGTALGTGTNQLGEVFAVIPPALRGAPWTIKLLHAFTGGTDGANAGPLTVAADGTLYGVTSGGGLVANCPNSLAPAAAGCGTIFKLMPPKNPFGKWTKTVLYQFTGGADGALPDGRLLINASGALYGTAASGGSAMCTGLFGPGCGVVFELTHRHGAWVETTLHSFDNTDGEEPAYDLLPTAGGGLAGVTIGGGATSTCIAPLLCTGNGTWFELTPPAAPSTSWTLSSYSFPGGTAGAVPTGGLLAQNGVFYGLLAEGGIGQGQFAPAEGAIYALTP